jgi:hypothetical protein
MACPSPSFLKKKKHSFLMLIWSPRCDNCKNPKKIIDVLMLKVIELNVSKLLLCTCANVVARRVV